MKKVACLFIVWQLVGAIGFWFWQVRSPMIGPVLWSLGFLLLLPGNLISNWAAGALLWHAHISEGLFDGVRLLGAIVVNSMVWMAITLAVRGIKSRRARRTLLVTRKWRFMR